MNTAGDTVLTTARGGMELTWRYAWALFLTQIVIQRTFPLPAAVCAFLSAAVLAQIPAGRNWRVYQKLLLQFVGFTAFALWAVHSIQYPALPFFSLGWVDHLLWEVKPVSQRLVAPLVLFCLWILWRGGRILVNSSRRYNPVCLHFDIGLGLLFLLLTVKAFVESKFGLDLLDRDIGFLTLAYFVFSLTAISIARNQSNVEKSFLAGHQGIGVILSVSVTVTLLAAGTILTVFPYLYSAADSLLIVTKSAAEPIGPLIIKTLLSLRNLKPRSPQNAGSGTAPPESSGMDSQTLVDADPQAVEGGVTLIQLILGWGLFSIIGMVILAVLVYILIYIVRLLLKRSRDDMTGPPSTGWIWDFLLKLALLPLVVWRGCVSLFCGIDSAASVYVGLLSWGRRSGIALSRSETPAAYGKRLTNGFPGLGTEIQLIVDAFNREAYGQTTHDRIILSRLRSAQRRMKRLRHWPSRLKVWFLH